MKDFCRPVPEGGYKQAAGFPLGKSKEIAVG